MLVRIILSFYGRTKNYSYSSKSTFKNKRLLPNPLYLLVGLFHQKTWWTPWWPKRWYRFLKLLFPRFIPLAKHNLCLVDFDPNSSVHRVPIFDYPLSAHSLFRYLKLPCVSRPPRLGLERFDPGETRKSAILTARAQKGTTATNGTPNVAQT